jgi:ubiquinol-cytochrome c reductase cytochrome c subunit
MSRRRFFWGYLAVFVMLAVPGALVFLPGSSQRAVADPAVLLPLFQQSLGEGQTLYEERCASCHGADAAGTSQAPPIVGLGPAFYDFMMSTGRMPLDQPTQQATRRRPVLTRTQIDEVSAYLTSLGAGGIPIPQVDVNLGSLSVGQQVYEADCAPCHGATGNGGAVGPRFAPNLHEATATQIAEAVRIGPTVMPQFDETTIPKGELDSLVRYVLYLRHPDDRGGQPLNRAGPLIEGFVALLVGLGVLVVMTRFIGERS